MNTTKQARGRQHGSVSSLIALATMAATVVATTVGAFSPMISSTSLASSHRSLLHRSSQNSFVLSKRSSFPYTRNESSSSSPRTRSVNTALLMGLDLVTYLRTEFVSAALCTNQTPRSANVCLQLGCEDGRAVTFIPRTIETLITSTVEPDGILPVSVRRQLTQQQTNRGGGAKVSFVDQRADDLSETPDESVDIVISLQAAARMQENGLDWRKSVQEAARVLKPGGRFLFVEQSTLDNGMKYLEYVGNLGLYDMDESKTKEDEEAESGSEEDDDEDDDDAYPTFECIGYDEVDFVLTPHIAGVFMKSQDAGLTPDERAAKEAEVEKERLAEISLSAFERGNKKRRRKKKKRDTESTEV